MELPNPSTNNLEVKTSEICDVEVENPSPTLLGEIMEEDQSLRQTSPLSTALPRTMTATAPDVHTCVLRLPLPLSSQQRRLQEITQSFPHWSTTNHVGLEEVRLVCVLHNCSEVNDPKMQTATMVTKSAASCTNTVHSTVPPSQNNISTSTDLIVLKDDILTITLTNCGVAANAAINATTCPIPCLSEPNVVRLPDGMIVNQRDFVKMVKYPLPAFPFPEDFLDAQISEELIASYVPEFNNLSTSTPCNSSQMDHEENEKVAEILSREIDECVARLNSFSICAAQCSSSTINNESDEKKTYLGELGLIPKDALPEKKSAWENPAYLPFSSPFIATSSKKSVAHVRKTSRARTAVPKKQRDRNVKTERSPSAPRLPPMKRGPMTYQDLKKYNGLNEEGRVCIAVNGKVFDVTEGKQFSSPGGIFYSLAGRDASRSFATFSLEVATDDYDDLSDLSSKQMNIVSKWEKSFQEKYQYVGRLLKPGEEPTDLSDEEEPSPSSSKKDE